MLIPLVTRLGLFHPRLSKRQETIDAFSAIDALVRCAFKNNAVQETSWPTALRTS